MKKIVVNPDFENLRSYVESLPENFDSRGEILEARRNIIRIDSPMGTKLVIKSFRRIYLANRIRYSYFFPSKAKRAYEYAMMLIKNGFNTPAPIGYIEVWRLGLISDSYFICEFTDFQPLSTLADAPLESNRELITEFAAFTSQLHQRQLYHVDYSLGNILFKRINGRYEFSLIDNNRMIFGPVTFNKGIKNLVRLGLPMDQLIFIIKKYANMMNWDEDLSLKLFQGYKTKELRKREMKKKIKSVKKAVLGNK